MACGGAQLNFWGGFFAVLLSLEADTIQLR